MQDNWSFEITKCRICSGDLESVWELGIIESAGYFPSKKNEEVPRAPLTLSSCQDCSLVQLRDNYDLNFLFRNYYGYASGTNESMVNHIKDLVATSVLSFFPESVSGKQSLTVLDIGSNDGTLLMEFKNRYQSKCYAVDPTIEQHSDRYNNVTAFSTFFDFEFANSRLQDDYFDLVYSIAMFYDTLDPVNFARGVRRILKPNGVWIIEVSYLPLVMKRNAFDSICHEHLEYYRLTDIINIARLSDLKVIDASTNDSNGGSLRVFLAPTKSNYEPNDSRVSKILAQELSGDSLVSHLISMKRRIDQQGIALRNLLSQRRQASIPLLVVGASTKGNVLMSYFKLDELGMLGCIDRNPSKVGRFTPVGHLLINDENYSLAFPSWHGLVLPWHFKESIVERERKRKRENQVIELIFPLPEVQMLKI